jgi:hypothetical protein
LAQNYPDDWGIRITGARITERPPYNDLVYGLDGAFSL